MNLLDSLLKRLMGISTLIERFIEPQYFVKSESIDSTGVVVVVKRIFRETMYLTKSGREVEYARSTTFYDKSKAQEAVMLHKEELQDQKKRKMARKKKMLKFDEWVK